MASHVPETVYEEISIPYRAFGSLFLRNKRPAGVDHFTGDKIIIMLHGATYPGVSFDMGFGGVSWMDYAARRGFDVYAPDLLGYGRSARPESKAPFMRRMEASIVVDTIIDFVRKRRAASAVNLVGWCRGARLAAVHAAQHPGAVRRLALYAMRNVDRETAVSSPDEELGAYRLVTPESIRGHWREDCLAEGIDDAMMEKIFPKAHFDEWIKVIFATDPAGNGATMRVPTGPIADEQDFLKGVLPKSTFRNKQVTAPVLLIRGEWDRTASHTMMEKFYHQFANAAWKRMVTVKEASHFLFLERNRMELYRDVQDFIEMDAPAG